MSGDEYLVTYVAGDGIERTEAVKPTPAPAESLNDRALFIDRVTGFLVPEDDARSRESMTLDGIYSGDSARIQELIRTAYRRGIRRGAAAAWNARQPITLR